MRMLQSSFFLLTNACFCSRIIKVIFTRPLMSGCGAVGRALPWGGRGRGFKSRHSDQLYVTKKITCQKSPIIRTFLRIWTLKFYSQNRGSPKDFFECFWDLNGRFFIFKRTQSRFGEKIPKSALFYPEKLSQSLKRFLVRYAELIEK